MNTGEKKIMETGEARVTRLPEDKNLNIPALSGLFAVMNQSYKLLWFRSILMGIREGKSKQSFDEIIDRMVVDAWHPVVEQRLSLGLADAVEMLAKVLRDAEGLPVDVPPEQIVAALHSSGNGEIPKLKKRLIKRFPTLWTITRFAG